MENCPKKKRKMMDGEMHKADIEAMLIIMAAISAAFIYLAKLGIF